MTEIRDAVAACLEKRTGVRSVGQKSRTAGAYPALVVRVRRGGSILFAGGRQVEQRCTVTVQVAADRERNETPALLERCTAALLKGVPCGKRHLRPEDVKSEGDTLSFSLTVCALVPRTEGEEPEIMRQVHVDGL